MPNTAVTRRTFLATTSLTSLGAAQALRRPVGGLKTHPPATVRLDPAILSSPLPAQALLPEPLLPLDLQQLAASAVDAATQAGATYADVRLGERHEIWLHWLYLGYGQPEVDLRSTLTYGIRVLVNGAWAFVHGSTPSVDAVTAAARDAVATAKGYAPLVVYRAELTSEPVAKGTWATPFREDPFAVPLREHNAMMDLYYQLTRRVPGTGPGDWGWPLFVWTREARAFASSEGALVTQILRGVRPFVLVTAANEVARLSLRFPEVTAMAGGYETVSETSRYEEAYQTLAEQMAHYLSLPRRSVEVGRYPLVADGTSVGVMFGRTLGTALELDRVLGEDADASGTSYVSPPLELLGTQIANPQLTVTATRALPTPVAVRWDDEGVEPRDYPVITNGRLVNYHTSRWTAPVLRVWFERAGQPLRSYGCAVVSDAADSPAVRAPHVQVAPNRTPASLDMLCQEVGNGLLLLGLQEYTPDQQFAAGSVHLDRRDGPRVGLLLKLERGKVVARVAGNGLDMMTKRFWNEQLITLGDAHTVRHTDVDDPKGMPWRRTLQSASAPAALFKEVNVTAHPRAK